MRVLKDSRTVAVGASSPAPAPLLHMPWGSFDGTAGKEVEPEAGFILLVAGLGLLCILWQILTLVFELCFDGDAAAPAPPPPPPPPPHAAAATAAAGGPPDSDVAWLLKRGLRRIPVVVYEVRAGESATDDDCVICLGEFDDGDKVRVLPRCRHSFHVQCIDPWLAVAKHPSCPTCRDSLRN